MTDGFYKIDLHMHSTVSDGTDSPELIAKKVLAEKINIFSVTDHDAVKASEITAPIARESGITFIPGVEFSCKDKNGKYHILGYGFDPESKFIQDVVKQSHGYRIKKVVSRLDFLKSQYGFEFPEEEVSKLLSLDNPGKPHIGNLMVKYGYAESRGQAITEYINKKHFENEYVRPEEAIAGIIGGGGKAVLAHPFFGSGDELILGEDMENRILRLMEYGLCGLEAFYSGFSEKLTSEALSLAEKYNLYVTAGSDYHGENKLIKLGDTGLDAKTEFPDGLRRFLALFERK